jgi:hypothetical protein
MEPPAEPLFADIYWDIAAHLPLKAAVRVIRGTFPSTQEFPAALSTALSRIYERDFAVAHRAYVESVISDEESALFEACVDTAEQVYTRVSKDALTTEVRRWLRMALLQEGQKSWRELKEALRKSPDAAEEWIQAAQQKVAESAITATPAFPTRAFYYLMAVFMVDRLSSTYHDDVLTAWSWPGDDGPCQFSVRWPMGPHHKSELFAFVTDPLQMDVTVVGLMNEANRDMPDMRKSTDWVSTQRAAQTSAKKWLVKIFTYIMESVHPGLCGRLPVARSIMTPGKTGEYRLMRQPRPGRYVREPYLAPPNVAIVALRHGFSVALDDDPDLPAAESSVLWLDGAAHVIIVPGRLFYFHDIVLDMSHAAAYLTPPEKQ